MIGIHFCPNCGASIDGDRKTCPSCGTLLIDDRTEQNTGAVPPLEQSPYSQQGGIPGFNNPAYYDYYNRNVKRTGGYDGCAVAGMVLGIISIILCCFSWVDAALGVTGIVLSVFGMKSCKFKGCAVAGLICSIAGTLLGLLMLIVMMN